MRPLSCKQISLALGVAETKASQAMRPALAKVAACLMLFPDETMAELSVAALTLKRQWIMDDEWTQRLEAATSMRVAAMIPV